MKERALHGVVLVVGPDGAGKTTVVDELERQLGRPVVRAHARPGLIAGRTADGAPVTEPHAQRPRGTLASLAKLGIVFADTVLGSWLRWRRQGRRGLLVVERGWYDLAVDPHRYRLPRSFAPLVRLLGWLVPRAELVVLLTGDPAALHERKPEIGTTEVARQLEAWGHLAPRAGRQLLRIDTVSETPQTAAATIHAAYTGSSFEDRDRHWRRVPIAPRRLDLRATGPGPALAIYRPHRRIAALLIRLNPMLLHTPLARPARPPVPDLSALVGRWGRSATHLASFRSSASGRWVVGVADRRRLHTVVKLGLADDDGLKREHRALTTLSSSGTVKLPQPVGFEEDDTRRLLALDAFPVDGPPPTPVQVAELTATLTAGHLGQPVVHGDLAPWNVAVLADGAIAVWDWEEAQVGTARPLHDLTHYLVRSGHRLGSASAEATARLLTASDGPGAHHLAILGLPTDEAAAAVRRYLLTTRAASHAEAAFRAALAAALPETDPS